MDKAERIDFGLSCVLDFQAVLNQKKWKLKTNSPIMKDQEIAGFNVPFVFLDSEFALCFLFSEANLNLQLFKEGELEQESQLSYDDSDESIFLLFSSIINALG